MSWSEVAALGLRYGKYPLALLLVEAFYWFLTEPSDTLAPLQVVEAWMWHGITELIWGADAVSLSQHNGWTTRIDFHHSSFPGTFDSVGLYVSDECAGVHEMIFLSTLILITDDVPQRDRLRAVAVGCVLVFILNLARLVAFYPLALGGCLEAPNDPACLNDMWAFHRHVYEWGFLVVLIGLWLAWFTWVGGPRRVKDRSMAGRDRWRITPRKAWAWSEHRPVWQQPIMGAALAAASTDISSALAAASFLSKLSFSAVCLLVKLSSAAWATAAAWAGPQRSRSCATRASPPCFASFSASAL